jgi:hypothetical protein
MVKNRQRKNPLDAKYIWATDYEGIPTIIRFMLSQGSTFGDLDIYVLKTTRDLNLVNLDRNFNWHDFENLLYELDNNYVIEFNENYEGDNYKIADYLYRNNYINGEYIDGWYEHPSAMGDIGLILEILILNPSNVLEIVDIWDIDRYFSNN